MLVLATIGSWFAGYLGRIAKPLVSHLDAIILIKQEFLAHENCFRWIFVVMSRVSYSRNQAKVPWLKV